MPCVWEDLLKLGISRDPLARMQSLHPRYFEFFDLDRGFAVRFDRVQEAQQLETALRHALQPHNAPAPLVIRHRAGGAREWFRGAFDALRARAADCQAAGHELLDPLRPWIRERLEKNAHLLLTWTSMLTTGMLEAAGPPPAGSSMAGLINVLDAYAAMELPLRRWLPPEMVQWHAHRGGHCPPDAEECRCLRATETGRGQS